MGENTTGPGEPRSLGALGAHWLQELRTGFREVRWMPVLLYGGGAGLLMPLSMIQAGALAFIAGVIPVSVGLLLARSVKGHYGLHGFLAGLWGSALSAVLLAIVLFTTPFAGLAQTAQLGIANATPQAIWMTLTGFIALSLIAFSTFGATTAGRIEDRNRALRQQQTDRGGQLERPGAVRGADDIRGLSLPQLGHYVNTLFKKKGYTFRDYRFIDKDKHLDIWFELKGEPWHARLSVADKVNPGTIQGLLQEMKQEGCSKGVVITSTEFTPAAQQSARGRPVVLIDGSTLYEIAE